MLKADPLWYKDAVIYELHVRAFCDAAGDGVGDFRGLTQKLDYLQDLGVTAIWLLPFYPSPGRDDGYDIADYTDINPQYGNLDDFREFLKQAHERGLRVITELVINHTSDQHPWFQRARRAPAGSVNETSTSGAIRSKNTATRASSSKTSRPRIGPTTMWRKPTTGTGSTRTSPIGTSTTGCARRDCAADGLLVRHGGRWPAARCDPVSLRA